MLSILFIFNNPAHTAAQIITTYAGNGLTGYSGNGEAATSALLNLPTSIVTDRAGNLYINDQGNNCVRKVDTFGIITTFAGHGTGGLGDGGPATNATLSGNWGIAVDDTGNIYITDQYHYRVRKVSTSGIITTFAGNGTFGNTGDGGPATAAEFLSPLGIAVDGSGNVYIGDPSSFCVRKVSPSGIISTFAGNGTNGDGGDGGPATNAQLSQVWGLATDAQGNVYICDGENNRVRKVSTSGIITTIAGTGTAGSGGDGGPATSARLDQPTGVFAGTSGDIYIADFYNNRVRMINTAGVISTIAGTGVMGFSGDGGPAPAAKLSYPVSVTMDDSLNIYIADLNNVRIRKINTLPALFFNLGHAQSLTVCEDAAATAVNSLLAATDYYTGITDTWSVVTPPTYGMALISYTTTATGGGSLTPIGASYTPQSGYAGNDSFRVSVSDGIESDTTTIHVTINPALASAGTITGATNVCIGAIITLTDILSGGTWSTGYMASLQPTTGGTLVTGILPGIDTIQYTLTGCGVATSIKVITVNPLPDAGTITGSGHVCIGSSVTYTETIAGGIWSNTYGKTTIAPIPGGSIVMGIATGTDIINYSVTDSVCTGVAIHPLVIDTIPQTGTITGASDICVGATAVYTDAAQFGSWSSDTSGIASVKTDTVTGLASGVCSLSYNVSNSCGTFTATKSINIIPPPSAPSVSDFENILSAPIGYNSYQWLLNGNPIQGANTDSFQVSQFPATYSVMVTDSLGCPATSAGETYNGCVTSDISIFPNPSTSVIYVAWCKQLNARIMCADGKTLETIDNAYKIDLSELPDGIYFISLFDVKGNKLMTKRINKLN